MTIRVFAAAALAVSALVASARAEEKRPVPLYTNEDLRRMEPLRGETGATSVPAVEIGPPDPARPAEKEAFWRRETLRVRHHVMALREREGALRGRLEDARARRASSGGGGARARPSTVSPTRQLERQIEALEARIREEEGDLEDRARRAGALPGWLR